MKKILALAVLLICFATSYSQVKISQMPRWTGSPDAVILPMVSGTTNYYITGLDLVNKSSGKYDSILMASVKRLKDTANALRVTINGINFYDSTLMASVKRLKDTANAIRISLNAKTFYDSTLMASTKRLKDTAAAIRSTIVPFYDSTLMASTKRLKDTANAIRTSFGNISTTFLGKNITTGQDSSSASILFKTLNGASAVQQHAITFNFRATDTTANTAFYYPLVFNGLSSRSKGNFSIKSETNTIAGQTGPDDVLSICYGCDIGTLNDSNRFIRIGIESNFRQPGQPDSARQFEFHIPEVGYTSPGNVSSNYRPASWIGSRTHPAGAWIFHADSYAFAFAGNDNVRLSADDNNVIAQTVGDGHFKFLNAGAAAGLDLQLTGSGTSMSINNPATINYGGTFAIAAVLGTNYYPNAAGNTIHLNSFTNDLFVNGFTSTFSNLMSQNTGEWSWNIPSSGGYYYQWKTGGTARFEIVGAQTKSYNPFVTYDRVTIATGVTPSSGALLQILGSTVNAAEINFGMGVDPTSSNNGDAWATIGHLNYKDQGTIYDLLSFTKGSPFNNFSFAYGTSITLGLVAPDNYYTIVQRELGNSATTPNYAVSSTAARTACFKLASFQGTKLQGASIGDPAFNMSRWAANTASLDSTHLFAEMKAGYRWLTAFQFTDTLQFYRVVAGTVNPNVTTSQSALAALALDTLKDLGSRSVFFGTNSFFKQSLVANETYSNTNVKGKYLIIGVWADTVGGSRIQFAVDGVTIGTYDPNGRAVNTDLDAAGFRRPGIINDVIVINTAKDTLHTVVLTFLDGGKFGGVDFIGNMKEPSVAAWAPIYIPDIQHMNSTGYALTGGSAAIQDSATNSRLADLKSVFPLYYAAGAIVPVHINVGQGGHFDPNDATQLAVDGVHPRGPGYRNYVIDIMAAINPKSITNNSSVPTGSNLVALINNGALSSNSAFTFDGTHLTIGNTGIATDDISVRHDQTGATFMRAWNANTGGASGYQAVVDNNKAIALEMKGSTSAAYGAAVSTSGGLYSTNPIWLMADAAVNISLAAGSQAPPNTLITLFGASGNIQTGTNPTDIASAIFGISSTSKGFLPPRMTNAQANAISSPATGLMVYCTDCTAVDASTGVIEVWNGTVFKKAW